MITTVLGEISVRELGYVLPHEHILSDLRPLVAPMNTEEFKQRITLENHGLLMRNPYAVLDNAVLDERDIQTEEILKFKKAGGKTVVDVTTKDFGRDPKFLYTLAKKTGLNIIAGCGYYIDAAHLPEVANWSVQQIADRIIRDLNTGMDDTDIKAGLIGEVGTSELITENEYKSLEASAIAQAEMGVGMHIHACLWNCEGLNALKFAVSKGADAEKTCIDHTDVLLDMEYIKKVLDMGAMIEFDNFGKEFYVDRHSRNVLKGSFATDKERVISIKKLIDLGYIKQLLLSNDICLKSMTHTYGGWGYDHVLTNIIPMMWDFGITNEQIDIIMQENPARFLDRK